MEPVNAYADLCRLANIMPVTQPIQLYEFISNKSLAEQSREIRLTAAIHAILDLIKENKIDTGVDVISLAIKRIDDLLSRSVTDILHNKHYQSLESRWFSLAQLCAKASQIDNTYIDLLDISQSDMLYDIEASTQKTKTKLYQQVYIDEYDTPGAMPISVIISDYEFDNSQKDIKLLQQIASVSESALCPFIAQVGPKFFGKNHFQDVLSSNNLAMYLRQAEFMHWQSFRETEAARFVGLCMPRYLLRKPYQESVLKQSFEYYEQVDVKKSDDFLWASASFAFASNLINSFAKYGWLVSIRGPEAGGMVKDLPVYAYENGNGWQYLCPTEVMISETNELLLAKQGFLPLCYYKDTDSACFFSASSTQLAAEFKDSKANATSRINTRLPYIFLCARIGHYLKVLQRENIGNTKSAHTLELELNRWLQNLVTKVKQPDASLAAKYPLAEAKVSLQERADNPGFYRAELYVRPHFQLEGVDIHIAMVTQLPTSSKLH